MDLSCGLADATQYYSFDNEMYTEILQLIGVKHYPVRVPPQKWPDLKLIGKAMVKGWAVPCRYYPKPWRRGGFCKSFVYPGISDYEMQLVHQIMCGW